MCDPGFYNFRKNGRDYCKILDDLRSSGQGLKLGNNTHAIPCSTSNCRISLIQGLDCYDNADNCYRCEPGYWLIENEKKCINQMSDIPAGKGLYNNGVNNMTVIDCDLSKCENCKSDFSKCDKCSENRKFHISRRECVNWFEFNEKTGLSPDNNNNIDQCLDNYCLNCQDNFQICQLCMDNFYFLEYEKDGNKIVKCSSLYEKPEGYRIEGKNFQKCLIDNCIDCQMDIQRCTSCKSGYRRSKDGNRCLSNCSEGKFEADDLICKNCMEGCKFCRSLEICDKCREDLMLISDQTMCTKCNEPGVFFDEEINLCMRCHKDCYTCNGPSRNECTSCIYPYYLKKDGFCFLKKIDLTGGHISEFASKLITTWSENLKINNTSSKSDKELLLEQISLEIVKEEKEKVLIEIKEITIESNNLVLFFNFNTNFNNAKGTLKFKDQRLLISTLEKYSSLEKNIYKIENLNFYRDEKLENLIQKITYIFGIALTILFWIIFLTNPKKGASIIRATQLALLPLIFNFNQPANCLIFSNIIRKGAFNFFPSLFFFVSDGNCGQLKEVYLKNEMECQALKSGGRYLLLILITILIKFVALQIFNHLSKEKIEGKKFWKTIKDYFNFEYYANFFSGIQLELYLKLMISISTIKTNSVFAVLNILFYFMIMIGLVIYIILNYCWISRIADIEKTKNEEDKEKIIKKNQKILFLISEYKSNHFFQTYYQMFDLILNPLLIAGFGMFMTVPTAQIPVVTVLHFVFFMGIFFYMPYKYKTENFRIVCSHLLLFISNVLVNIIHILENSIDRKTQYTILGNILIFVIALNLFVNYGILILGMISKGFKKMKKIRDSKKNNKVKSENLEESQEQSFIKNLNEKKDEVDGELSFGIGNEERIKKRTSLKVKDSVVEIENKLEQSILVNGPELRSSVAIKEKRSLKKSSVASIKKINLSNINKQRDQLK